jgi:hypothetical protein
VASAGGLMLALLSTCSCRWVDAGAAFNVYLHATCTCMQQPWQATQQDTAQPSATPHRLPQPA